MYKWSQKKGKLDYRENYGYTILKCLNGENDYCTSLSRIKDLQKFSYNPYKKVATIMVIIIFFQIVHSLKIITQVKE